MSTFGELDSSWAKRFKDELKGWEGTKTLPSHIIVGKHLYDILYRCAFFEKAKSNFDLIDGALYFQKIKILADVMRPYSEEIICGVEVKKPYAFKTT